MLILYDFKCDRCDTVHEALSKRGSNSEFHSVCPSCGEVALRTITPIRFKLEGHSGDFPTAAAKWERQHEKAGREPSETDPSGW